ncbi:hypothetical protein [Nocardia sp. NPDC020380]|uniref:hypothetical protein n=1 Tax=Nocardia sp. NPDC020380 TaxID=3364309 RepID=UPI0037BAA1D6
MDDEGVYRVRFSALCPDDEKAAQAFYAQLRELGGMVVYGTYPGAVVIGITEDAAARVAAFSFVESVENVRATDSVA